jgi:putative transposase
MEAPVRKVTYKLYPSRNQLFALRETRRLHQQIYNACLDQRIDAYRKRGIAVSYADQCRELTDLRRECPEFATVNCSSQQVTLRRLDKAFKAFFDRAKKGTGSAGFPRFKSLRSYPGFGFKAHGDGWRFVPGADWTHGKLRLQGIGIIKARGQARQGGTIKSCELLHRDGTWYLSLTLECLEIVRQSGTDACASDWGVETFLTLAVANQDGEPIEETIENPRWFQSERAKITSLQRSVSSRKRGSNRRKTAVRRLAKARARTARRRLDWHHKLSAKMVGRFALIASESLTIRNLTAKGTVEEPGKMVARKAGLNREILDTAPSQYEAILKYKASEAGTIRMEAPTRKLKPSQTCPCCGSVRKKTLSERTHKCKGCGRILPRDFASAWVVLDWALQSLEPVGLEQAEAA